MRIYSESLEFVSQVVDADPAWAEVDNSDCRLIPERLLKSILKSGSIYETSVQREGLFGSMLITEKSDESQYDIAVDLQKSNVEIPHGTLCLAGSGARFHGQRDRSWSSPPGNIYLTVVFVPKKEIDHFGPGFVILPAVSVLDTIDSIEGLEGRASLKWVNDILIDKAKVAGVLTYSQAMGKDVTGVVLGIGLNVETTPDVELTHFVRDVACLSDYVDDYRLCNRRLVLEKLLHHLEKNYRILEGGGYFKLLDKYGTRSAIVGKKVTICSDDGDAEEKVIARGIVREIGENLELYLQGQAKPVSRGRLVLET